MNMDAGIRSLSAVLVMTSVSGASSQVNLTSLTDPTKKENIRPDFSRIARGGIARVKRSIVRGISGHPVQACEESDRRYHGNRLRVRAAKRLGRLCALDLSSNESERLRSRFRPKRQDRRVVV